MSIIPNGPNMPFNQWAITEAALNKAQYDALVGSLEPGRLAKLDTIYGISVGDIHELSEELTRHNLSIKDLIEIIKEINNE